MQNWCSIVLDRNRVLLDGRVFTEFYVGAARRGLVEDGASYPMRVGNVPALSRRAGLFVDAPRHVGTIVLVLGEDAGDRLLPWRSLRSDDHNPSYSWLSATDRKSVV